MLAAGRLRGWQWKPLWERRTRWKGACFLLFLVLFVEGTRALYLPIYAWRNMYFCDLVRYVDADILHRFAGLHSLSSYLENEYPTPLAASMSQIPGPTAAVLMCGLDD